MDKNFLEFWGNFMLNAAKGQQQVENINRWMKGGSGDGFQELTSMFKKAYGLDSSEKSPEYAGFWKKASEDFFNSFKESMGLMGMVSKEEHLNLVRKYETLKEKAENQDETIRHLRMLLGEKDIEQKEISGKFQELAKSQTDQFQELVKNFRQCYQGSSSKTEEKKGS
ncbi:MAG: hypothetical protein BWK80_39345 [Desulfobacteraceae bacterium IS3]|nr:MAG: hypothetical protein BWK80_39345 [Desulfobacteraceae bacterium IS3]HAO20690.1 hypothetical protein [Desulfobacteraceae bacterium]